MIMGATRLRRALSKGNLELTLTLAKPFITYTKLKCLTISVFALVNLVLIHLFSRRSQSVILPDIESSDSEDQDPWPLKNENEKMWDGQSTELEVGLTFKTRGEAKEFVRMYAAVALCKFVIVDGGAGDSCKGKKLVWGCTYGKERRSVATTKRPVQHTKKQGCLAYLRFFCRGTKDERKVCVLKSFCEDHNHEISKSMFKQECDKIEEVEEITSVKDAILLNSTAGQVRKVMKHKYQKEITREHAVYIMKKVKGPDLEKEQLAGFLEKVEADGGLVEVMTMSDTNSKVRGLVVQTSVMRKAYLGCSPNIVMVDTTFNFESSGYRLSAFCYSNPVSGRGEVGQLVFLADESCECFKFAFEAFKKSINGEDPPVILIDKDFNEMQTLKSVFVTSRILLCHFHVIKWWRSLISSAVSSDSCADPIYERKSVILGKLKELVYAHTETEFAEKLTEFQEISEDVKVKVGAHASARLVDLWVYYQKNWAECVDMWATFKRNSIPGLENMNTNNHLERLWRTLKQFLDKMVPGVTTIFKAVLNLVQFCDERLDEKYTWDKRHIMRIYDEDPEVRDMYARASLKLNDKGVLKFKESFEKLLQKANSLEVVQTGVKERFKKPVGEHQVNDDLGDDSEDLVEELEFIENMDSQTSKIYATTIDKCNCKWSIRNLAPCRHILFLRMNTNEDPFHEDLFNSMYSKKRNLDLERVDFKDIAPDISKEYDIESTVEDDVGEPKTLTMNERFKLLSPLCDRLLNAMTRCGTEKVNMYCEELEHCILNVKNGASLFSKMKDVVTEQEQDSSKSLSKEAETNENDFAKEDIIKGKFDLDWLERTKHGKVGRPKSSKVSFSFKSGVDKKCKGLKKLPSVLSNPQDTPLICSFPPNPNQPRQGAIHVGDYLTLAPGSFISNFLLDFQIRIMKHDRPADSGVWLMTNEMTQILAGNWWEIPAFCHQLEAAKLYESGGSDLIVLPLCENNHFFTVVAECGPQDYIFIMESIGGYPVPKRVENLRQFLRDIRTSKGWDPVDPVIVTLDAPKQVAGSNDCGLFTLETISHIVYDPEGFRVKAHNNETGNLYPADQGSARRREFANMIKDLGEQQRLPGELHAGEPPLELPNIHGGSLRSSCSSSTKTKRLRKCGLCQDTGHTRRKCPMKLGLVSGEESPILSKKVKVANMGVGKTDCENNLKKTIPERSERYRVFLKQLHNCSLRLTNSLNTSLTLPQIKTFLKDIPDNNPNFTDGEIENFLELFETEGEIMMVDSIVYFIT